MNECMSTELKEEICRKKLSKKSCCGYITNILCLLILVHA